MEAKNLRTLEGVVEDISYTMNGAGNQWTTIDGVRYATFWDIRTKEWDKGDRVRFDCFEAPFFYGHPPVLQATNISRISETEKGSSAPYQPFRVMVQGRHDYTLDAFAIDSEEYGTLLVIGTPDAAIYLTRQQAIEFFGLREPDAHSENNEPSTERATA